uniref:Uncharacterized protein n=1 Tax=Panagrellus redivivus TaxID=6233 RepID=A0A7E4UYA9_PANRE
MKNACILKLPHFAITVFDEKVDLWACRLQHQPSDILFHQQLAPSALWRLNRTSASSKTAVKREFYNILRSLYRFPNVALRVFVCEKGHGIDFCQKDKLPKDCETRDPDVIAA